MESGEWPAGTKIPPESSLVGEYGVSRTTVQRALYDLANEGRVVRRRRLGTFVTDTGTETSLLRFVNLFLSEPVSPGDHEPTDSRILLARDCELNHPDLDVLETVVQLERTKLSPGGSPFALETAVIPFRLIPDQANRPWVTSTTHQALRDNGHAPAQAKLYVDAYALNGRQAGLLRLDTGQATLRCLRYTWLADGTMAEISRYILSPRDRLFIERSLNNPHHG
jgi:DNA-binding GntR family transcriptional regulator